jgi:hypothetical protein
MFGVTKYTVNNAGAEKKRYPRTSGCVPFGVQYPGADSLHSVPRSRDGGRIGGSIQCPLPGSVTRTAESHHWRRTERKINAATAHTDRSAAIRPGCLPSSHVRRVCRWAQRGCRPMCWLVLTFLFFIFLYIQILHIVELVDFYKLFCAKSYAFVMKMLTRC